MKNSFQVLRASLFVVVCVVCPAVLRAQVVSSFTDLQIWAGSGGNQSGLVIQWNDSKSPQALAWGFHWSSPANVSDMLLAVLSADVRLFVRGDSATPFGPGYFGFGYQNSGNFSVTGAVDQFGASVTPVFVGGLSDMNTSSASTEAPTSSTSAVPTNAVDRYVEGWNDNGFWELFTGSGPAYPVTWASSAVGATEPLANNGWYVFSISQPDFTSNNPGAATAAAIPEPACGLLLLFGGGAAFYARRRFHAC